MGEIFPNYLTSSGERINELLDYRPDIKLLLNFRDPVERDWSAIRMIAKRRNQLDDESALLNIAQLKEIENKGDSSTHVFNWLDKVDRKSIFISSVKGIKNHPQEAIKAITHFLGANTDHFDHPPRVKKLFEAVHPGQDISMPESIKDLLDTKHLDTYRLFQEINLDFDH